MNMAYPLPMRFAMTFKEHISRIITVLVQKAIAYLDAFNKAAFDDLPGALIPQNDSDAADAACADARYELQASPELPADMLSKS